MKKHNLRKLRLWAVMKAFFPSQTLSFTIQSKQPFYVHRKNILSYLLILRVLMKKGKKHVNIWKHLY